MENKWNIVHTNIMQIFFPTNYRTHHQRDSTFQNYLQVTLDEVKGSKAKHSKGSWKVFFHSLVPVSAFHRIIDDGAWSTTNRSWQASWVPSHSRSRTGLFPSENSATELPWEMFQTITLPAASPEAKRRTYGEFKSWWKLLRAHFT